MRWDLSGTGGVVPAAAALSPAINATDNLRDARRAPYAPPCSEMWGGAMTARGVAREPSGSSAVSSRTKIAQATYRPWVGIEVVTFRVYPPRLEVARLNQSAGSLRP